MIEMAIKNVKTSLPIHDLDYIRLQVNFMRNSVSNQNFFMDLLRTRTLRGYTYDDLVRPLHQNSRVNVIPLMIQYKTFNRN